MALRIGGWATLSLLLGCVSGGPGKPVETTDSPAATDSTADSGAPPDTSWKATSGVPYQQVSSVSNGRGCALRGDGHVVCFGGPPGYYYAPNVPNVEFSSVAAYTSPCALDVDGYPVCWDWVSNADGYEVVVPEVRLDKVEVGSHFACGLGDGGVITCWGELVGSFTGVYADVYAHSNVVCGLTTAGGIECNQSKVAENSGYL